MSSQLYQKIEDSVELFPNSNVTGGVQSAPSGTLRKHCPQHYSDIYPIKPIKTLSKRNLTITVVAIT